MPLPLAALAVAVPLKAAAGYAIYRKFRAGRDAPVRSVRRGETPDRINQDAPEAHVTEEVR